MTKNEVVIGYPKANTHEFVGERRAFTPEFISMMAMLAHGAALISEGYGAQMDPPLVFNSTNIHTAKNERELYGQSKLVVSLKYPSDEYLNMLPQEAVLITMAHFPTRPGRVAHLNERGIRCISLDTMRDDMNERVVQDMRAVAMNGFDVAFNYLDKTDSAILSADPLEVIILGRGAVGRWAVDAAGKIGKRYGKKTVNIHPLGSNETANEAFFNDLLKKAHILVDASNRRDSMVPIVSNDRLALTREELAIIDLSADPYTKTCRRAIEGTPLGNLTQQVFLPDDPSYDHLPADVKSAVRRLVVSCDGWPGVYPSKSMRVYETQLAPFVTTFLTLAPTPAEAYDMLSLDSPNPLVRALYRGSLTYFGEESAQK